jgi:hypothetical protein
MCLHQNRQQLTPGLPAANAKLHVSAKSPETATAAVETAHASAAMIRQHQTHNSQKHSNAHKTAAALHNPAKNETATGISSENRRQYNFASPQKTPAQKFWPEFFFLCTACF